MAVTIQLSDFSLDSIPAGTKWKAWIHIGELPAGEQVRWPVLVAKGKNPGKVLLANAGTHGDEYEGIAAIHQLFRELDPQDLSGTMLAIPILNPPAVNAAERSGPLDQRNLARSFPGDEFGLYTERIAYRFATSIIPLADLYIDLHSAGTGVTIRPFIGCGLGDFSFNDYQRQATNAFGFEVVWNTGTLPGRTLSAAREAGIPSMYTESSGNRNCNPSEVADLVEGLKNLLRFIDALPGEYPTEQPRFIHEDPEPGAGHMQDYHRSQYGGLFLSAVKIWDRVEEGQTIGTVYDPFGDPLETLTASKSGRILTLRICPRILPGEFTAVIVPFAE